MRRVDAYSQDEQAHALSPFYLAEPGTVYTRPWAVDFILDLAGYEPEENLVDSMAVEPACGDGAFLEAMIRRLSFCCQYQGRHLRDCTGSLLALDLNPEAVATSRERAESTLVDCGWDRAESREMANGWVREADFLLDPELDLLGLGGGVGFVIGNPPYVRLEDIDERVVQTYRKRYKTMAGRADLYVGFFERALGMLEPDGVCTFICADRWMLNQYGSRLRGLITAGGFSVEAVVEMHRTNAFYDNVLAYPSITVIRRAEEQGNVLVARADQTSVNIATEISRAVGQARRSGQDDIKREARPEQEPSYVIVDEWFSGSDPWPSASPERLKLLKRLEADLPPLEEAETGTNVGIGVATGADKVFLTRDPGVVERERLLPVALAKDTMTGALEWSGHYLVNPWGPDGSLVDLKRYPRLLRYFKENADVLKERNVAQRNPSNWHRTIDKVNPFLLTRPKLLVPDIKNSAHPVYEEGYYYPHHNLYHVTSESWDLKVLGGILLSRVGQLFIECYAVRMNNGYLRFQAQYLRRIRVPRPETLDASTARELSEAFEHRDVEGATRAALRAYGIRELPD